jgi:hypothetical protein
LLEQLLLFLDTANLLFLLQRRLRLRLINRFLLLERPHQPVVIGRGVASAA